MRIRIAAVAARLSFKWNRPRLKAQFGTRTVSDVFNAANSLASTIMKATRAHFTAKLILKNSSYPNRSKNRINLVSLFIPCFSFFYFVFCQSNQIFQTKIRRKQQKKRIYKILTSQSLGLSFRKLNCLKITIKQ